MAFLIGGANSAADTGYDVANSCRFEDGDTPSLTKSNAGSGNQRTFTISTWVKFGSVAPSSRLFSIGDDVSNTIMSVFFTSGDLRFEDVQSGNNNIDFRTDAIFRDPSAWQHFAIMVDTTQGTEGNRVKIYHNGTQITSFSSSTYPDQNYDTLVNHTTGDMTIGARAASPSGSYFDGYMAEVVVLDGTAASIGDLGEFDEDSPTIWKPKDVSGLTFGTNGFYLDFEASDNLGNDANGGTDFTENNIAAADQATDTPTNNFATLNPLIIQGGTAPTMSEGNLKITIAGSFTQRPSTMVVNKGKWYAEVFMHTLSSSGQYATFGITGVDDLNTNHRGFAGSAAQGMIIALDNRANQTLIQSADSTITDPDIDPTDDDIVGMALDLDNGKMYFHLNGTYTNSGDPTSGATGTGATDVPTADIDYFITYGVDDSIISANFGGCQAFTISSAANDENGYGNFEYAPPSGYLALCTKNLAEYG